MAIGKFGPTHTGLAGSQHDVRFVRAQLVDITFGRNGGDERKGKKARFTSPTSMHGGISLYADDWLGSKELGDSECS